MNIDLEQSSFEPILIPGTGPERIRTVIHPNPESAVNELASIVAEKIRNRAEQGRTLVLGLPTGTTTCPFYRAMVRKYNEEGLSYKNVVVFALDEYYPLSPDSVHSYNAFLEKEFFSKVDLLKENIHTLNGAVPNDELYDYCSEYEAAITEAGGIDIQILGVGRRGHLGFNEPGAPTTTITRAVTLDNLTRADALEEFLGLENVPPKALTLGLGTIMKAKRIYLMAWGKAKAPIVRESIEGEVFTRVPPTILQHHSNTIFYLDAGAAESLTRFNTPWLVGHCDWNDRLIRKAVVWLCLRVDKPVLKLTDKHYSDNGLGELVTLNGSAGQINIKVFNDLQHTISGWPGGKPKVNDSNRPERNWPYPKRVIVFSPHPDDDVISMGGTLLRLVDHGHEVHVAYQTSGSVAVDDEYILKFLHFIDSYEKFFKLPAERSAKISNEIRKFIQNRSLLETDTVDIRALKSLVRKGEAVAACRTFGISEEMLHFLNLPFYETGLAEKKPPGELDVQIVMELLEEIKPHQIYAAGDLADPHGTHKVCIEILLTALSRLKKQNCKWLDDCWLWLYRGAWQDWELEKVDMAVPISPDELSAKKRAIMKHASQKDGALFMGEDNREFWQRAEERNRSTAILYDQLGMAEYEAMELFVRHHF